MRLFGLQPDQVIARTPPAALTRVPTLPFSIAYGALSFAAVSVAAYSLYAFKRVPGTAAMYAAVAVVYLGLGGAALSVLVLGTGAAKRFAGVFALGFLLYALGWCAGWFTLKAKYHGEIWGSFLGLAALTWLVQRAFGHARDFLPAFGVLFLCHTLGFALGDNLHGLARYPFGGLLWGLGHGLGFGAGLGYVLFRAQEPLKMRLPATHAA